jgi:hypothetical protein
MIDRRTLLATAGATLLAGPQASFGQATPNKKLRIVVVANRYHEADGLMAALSNQMKQNPNLSYPYRVWSLQRPIYAPQPENSSFPRCLIDITKNPSDRAASATMEIWCIDDLVNARGDSGAKVAGMEAIRRYGSRQDGEKYGPAPDGVIAFGTAGYPGNVSNDGCATIGGTIFIHDAAKDVPPYQGGNWAWQGFMEKLVPSKTRATFFSGVASDNKLLKAISLEMISPQINPASALKLIIAPDAVGISSVNIPPVPYDPTKDPYCDIDSTAIKQAQAQGATNITSVETTHGVIRSVWPDAPFIYVTAIPNRVCSFKQEASGIYAQEFPASHNAGIALKYVVPYFASAIA